MRPPSHPAPPVDGTSGAEHTETGRPAVSTHGKTALGDLAAFSRLGITALAIVLALAFGIPWLIGLFW